MTGAGEVACLTRVLGCPSKQDGERRHTVDGLGLAAPPASGDGTDMLDVVASCAGTTSDAWDAPALELALDGGMPNGVGTNVDGACPEAAGAGAAKGNGPAELVRVATAGSTAIGKPELPEAKVCNRMCGTGLGDRSTNRRAVAAGDVLMPGDHAVGGL
mmetsp:Transcript_2068/g.5250  ORF Transcript_2068/g.5250 Transcript_2068/m.5250 type:complete len:159 (-) Transcript_2068:246-722(-)